MPGSTKKCPNCKTDNPVAANFCRHCRFEFPEATKKGGSIVPVIKYLRVRESDYCEGSKIHIEWDVENVTSLQLDGVDVMGDSCRVYKVGKNKNPVLLAKNDYNECSQTVHLKPVPVAKIVDFKCNRSIVQNGDDVTLKWDVEDAIRVIVRCNDEEVDVTDEKNLTLTISSNTNFTICAYSVDETINVEKNLEVNVIDKVNIESFSVDNASIVESQPIELTWKVDNADEIILLPSHQVVTKMTGITLYPKHNTIYTLMATNRISSAEEYISVNVQPLPKVDLDFGDCLTPIKIPELSIDLSPMMSSIQETEIDKWMMSPMEQEPVLNITGNSVFKKLKSLLEGDSVKRKK